MRNDKIDIVYLWVDGNDKKWRASRNTWYNKLNTLKNKDKNNLNDSLYRDNGELKYSLRSVAECANWINHIYIITGFNQVPKWLNTKHPKITIIPHEQIMPKEALPTFNSNSIEMCISNISNLSERFILMNDDTFFNKKIKPNFFFDSFGCAKLLYNNHKNSCPDVKQWLNQSDNYTRTLILSALKIKEIFGKDFLRFRPSHGIDPYIKSSIIQCKNHPLIKPDLDKQIKNKFRTGNEFQRWIFNLYSVVSGTTILKKARGYKSGRHWLSNFIYNTIHWRAVRMSPIFCFDAINNQKSIKHAPIFCINDSQETTNETTKNNIKYLQQRFPNKCEFEK